MDTGSLRTSPNHVNLAERGTAGATRHRRLLLLMAAAAFPLAAAGETNRQPADSPVVVAQWTLALQQDGTAVDRISGAKAQIKGNIYPAVSPVGDALQFDGYTGAIAASPIPFLDNPSRIAISAWVQLEAYPWNRVPILDQETPRGSFFFGIDEVGHLVEKNGSSNTVVLSEDSIPLRRWALVTVSLEDDAVSFTINGSTTKALSTQEAEASATQSASANNLIIGHVRSPLLPGPAKSIHPELPVEYSIQGSLGEVTIDGGPLPASDIKQMLASANQELLKPKPWPPLPRWQGGPGTFGAFYTTLHFDPLWDKTRRVGPDSDVVVRFDDSPVQLIFWQGNNYVPAWVTENNRWYTDEFMEIYGHPRCPYGEDCEPMSDKQVRYSHVRILESTPARVVIDWRYALSEVQNYAIADAATPTAWGDWADEYWIVYPDHIAIRRSVLWSTAPDRNKTEFQESIVIVPPGETPEDSVHFDALTFANLDGQTATYSWEPKTIPGLSLPRGPASFPKPENPVIQWVNLKSRWKPFEVPWGEPITTDAYNREASISSFEWWNHWPVAQIPSSGRPALAADRPGHTSLSHLYWPAYQQNEQALTKLLLTGLTTLPAAELIPVAKSWRSPAGLALQDGHAVPYDPAQRAYVFPTGLSAPLRFSLRASKDHPAEHVAFIVPGWSGSAKLTVSGGAGPVQARYGTVQDLEGSRLILYVPIEAENDVEFELSH